MFETVFLCSVYILKKFLLSLLFSDEQTGLKGGLPPPGDIGECNLQFILHLWPRHSVKNPKGHIKFLNLISWLL